MSEHWRVRGHAFGDRLYVALSPCPALRTLVMWAYHRWALTYWYRREDGTWERIA